MGFDVGCCVGCDGYGYGYWVWGLDSVYCWLRGNDGSGHGGGARARGSWFCGPV